MGSTVDREIKITTTDTGVFDRLQKMKEGAMAMGRGIAEDARNQATSTRELISIMNDEIALIEKRNKLNQQGRQLDNQQKFDGSGQTKKTFREEQQKISVEGKEEQMQVDLLKQVLEAILKTSKEEVSVDRDAAKQKVASDKEIDTNQDHEEALQQMFRNQIIEDTEPGAEKKKEGGGRPIDAQMGGFIKESNAYSIGIDQTKQFVQRQAQKVENKLAQRTMLAGGAILGALGISMSSAGDLFESEGDLFRATGRKEGYESVKDMTQSQTNKRAAQMNMARGGEFGQGDINALLSYERSQGIDSTQLAKMKKLGGAENQHHGGVVNDPTTIMGTLKSVLREQGLDKSRTNDLLQASLSLQEAEFQGTGEANAVKNVGILNRLMTGMHAPSPGRALDTARNLSSMVEGGSDQLEAVKFSEFQKGGGGDYWDYLMEKEKGVSGKVDDVVIDRILESEMSRKDKLLSIHSLGMTPTQAEEIYEAGGVSPLIPEEMQKDGAGTVRREAAEAAAGGENPITKSAAMITDGFANVGHATVELVDSMLEATKKMVGVSEDMDNIRNSIPKTNEIHK